MEGEPKYSQLSAAALADIRQQEERKKSFNKLMEKTIPEDRLLKGSESRW
jgi:hypothetical protein